MNGFIKAANRLSQSIGQFLLMNARYNKAANLPSIILGGCADLF